MNPKKFLEQFRSRIGYRLVCQVLLFSSLIALLATSLQLYLDYRDERAAIDEFFHLIRSTQLQSVAQSVWILDDTQIDLQLAGMVHRPGLVAAEILVDGQVHWAEGDHRGDNIIQQSFPLTYLDHGREKWIGELRLTASLDGIYHRLYRRVLIILMSNGIKTFLVAGFALFLFQYLVARHLREMARHVREVHLHTKGSPLSLDRRRQHPRDELDQVVEGINVMEQRVRDAYARQLKNERRLRLFFDSTEEAIIGCDVAGFVTFTNRACQEMLGLESGAEALGREVSCLLKTPFSRQSGVRINKLLEQVVRSRKSVQDSRQVLGRNDGSCFPIRLHCYPVLDGKHCQGAVIFCIDISRQHRLEWEKQLLAEVVRQSPILVILSDYRGVIEYVNPGFEKITGYRAAEVLGRRPFFLRNDLRDRRQYSKMRRALRHQNLWRGRFVNRGGSGRHFSVDMIVSAIRDSSGTITNLVAVGNDISRELALREQLYQAQKLEAIGKLSASIAHEFGNPLLGIRFALRDIKERPQLSEEDRQRLALAEAECDRMKNLIRDLQQFNRPTSGVKRQLHLHTLLDSIILFLGQFFRNRGIQLQRDYDPQVDMVNGVEDQLRQVFVNLLLNSGEAIGDQGGQIILATSIRKKYIRVRVIDTGCGIAAENMEHIFEPFFSTKLAVEGTGLGLPVSYGIIKAHGGSITVRSTQGQGACFQVTLPRPGLDQPRG